MIRPEPNRVWRVVHCKPRQESVAEENLRRQGFETYLPKLQTRRRHAGRWIDGIQPLFPRYLFVRIDPQLQSTAPIRSTRGAVGLVRFGGLAAEVPDEVIKAIQDRAEETSGLHADPRRHLAAGERVRVMDGPLAGLEGIYDSVDGEARSFILLELLGKTHRLGLSLDWIARAA